MKHKITLALALATGIASFAENARGATILFSESNNAGFPSQGVGSLTITQVGNDTRWDLSANWDNTYNSSNPFVSGIYFTKAGSGIAQGTLPLTAVVGSVGLKSFSSTGVLFTTANNTNRFTDGEEVRWTFTNTLLSDFSDFRLQVNQINSGASVQFSPPSSSSTSAVPEASTRLGLLALGAGGLSTRRRLQRKA